MSRVRIEGHVETAVRRVELGKVGSVRREVRYRSPEAATFACCCCHDQDHGTSTSTSTSTPPQAIFYRPSQGEPSQALHASAVQILRNSNDSRTNITSAEASSNGVLSHYSSNTKVLVHDSLSQESVGFRNKCCSGISLLVRLPLLAGAQHRYLAPFTRACERAC